jgi:hypothetical protein
MTTHATHQGLAGNAARLFVLLAALGLLAALAVDQRPWERLLFPERGFGIVLDGRHFRVDSGTAEAIGRQSRIQADLGSERAADRVRELLAGELDGIFAELKGRVPDYADWYFSLTGEYTRLSMLILQRVGWQAGDQLWERTEDLIFGGDEFAERLAAVEGRAAAQLTVLALEQRAAWLAELLQLLAPGSDKVEALGTPVAVLALDDLAAEFGGHGRSEFLTRVSASAAGAGSAGIAAPCWRGWRHVPRWPRSRAEAWPPRAPAEAPPGPVQPGPACSVAQPRGRRPSPVPCWSEVQPGWPPTGRC